MATTVYTDGACSGNPGPGGWAWAVPGGAFASGASPASTNQRMELTAALEAVRALSGPLEVVSDSTYVVNCFRDRWWEGWLRRGWINTAKKPVANKDLWEPLIDEYRREPGRVSFRWVKGHSGDVMNDLVDRLAVEAALKQVGRSGTGTPSLAPPAGRRVAVVGDVTGLDLQRLFDVVVAKRAQHPGLVLVTDLWVGDPGRVDGVVENADEAIVLGDESVEWVARLVRSLRDRLGEEEVWVLGP